MFGAALTLVPHSNATLTSTLSCTDRYTNQGVVFLLKKNWGGFGGGGGDRDRSNHLSYDYLNSCGLHDANQPSGNPPSKGKCLSAGTTGNRNVSRPAAR